MPCRDRVRLATAQRPRQPDILL